jgi:transketolase
MRNTFANTIVNLAISNPKLMLLTGDLGFSVFEPFIDKCPTQYINCGMMEQSMTGIAAGLASEGFLPIIYSIIPFVTMRNIEQIRNDICYQNLPVTIVGVGAGFSYGPYGHTHHALEDIGMLRTLPNLRILTPGDPYEVEKLTEQIFANPQPTYIRIGKKGEPILHKQTTKILIGKTITMKSGNDIALLSNSTMLDSTILVSEELKKVHINARVISIPTMKPLDVTDIIKSAEQTKLIVTIEEHSIIGGLGSLIAEILVDSNSMHPLLRLGFTKSIGTQEHMRDVNGLSVKTLVKRILERFEHLE